MSYTIRKLSTNLLSERYDPCDYTECATFKEVKRELARSNFWFYGNGSHVLDANGAIAFSTDDWNYAESCKQEFGTPITLRELKFNREADLECRAS